MLIAELLGYLFGDQPHPLAPLLADWLASSRRFTTFVTTFRSKIRKKIRTTQDDDGALDLRLELETAYCLLRERALDLVYEPQTDGHARSPDFAVTFTTSTTFMIEVTRLRLNLAAPSEEEQVRVVSRLIDMVCGKLGQLLPQRSNVLLVGIRDAYLSDAELHAILLQIQQRAEQNDPGIIQRHKFRDRADFFQHYQRLSELIVRPIPLGVAAPLPIWINPQSKYPLPSKAQTALARSLAQPA